MNKVKMAMILVFLTAVTASAQTVTCTTTNPGYGLDSITTCTGPVAQPPAQPFHAVALDVKPGPTYQELEMQRLQLEAARLQVNAMRAQQQAQHLSADTVSHAFPPTAECITNAICAASHPEAQKLAQTERKEAQKRLKRFQKEQQKEKQKQEKK